MANTQQAGSGTLLLILVQVASRGLTFIGNQFLLRFLSPSLLGIAVQLELVSVTCLYFARESLRVALQRQPPSLSPATQKESTSTTTGDKGTAARRRETQTVVNLSYLAVLLGFAISSIFGYFYLRGVAHEALQSPYFGPSFQIYATATIIELLAEPAFVVIQQRGLFQERARAETSAAMARCFAACAIALFGHRRGVDPSILPFAAGQAAYAATLLGLYLLPVLRLSKVENFHLVPAAVVRSGSSMSTASAQYHFGLFHKEILSLATTMYMQSVFKLLLTQGDALIMSFLSSLADQGAFALASNYGGLLARLVFQPVEESSRNTFGRLLARGPAVDNASPVAASTSNPIDDDQGELSRPESRKASDRHANGTNTNTRAALGYLSTTLRLYLLFARPLVTLAPAILPALVPFVLSPQWRTPSTITLLQTYCYYIPLMAVNGILDAFVTSVATPAQLRSQSLWMLAFTGVYAAAAWMMMDLWEMGSVGLVGANMLNMALRVGWSVRYIRAWVRERESEKETETEMGQKGLGLGLWRGMLREVMPNVGAVLGVVILVVAVTVSSRWSGMNVRAVNTGEVSFGDVLVWVAGAGILVSTM
ncbi:hypothetical protein A1O7_00843 [Cladophialophora yegresii CBS 114405]|uniref:Man(5)GlcNAc(2)-PP-dolichol translocation protein RFT1 n=1 Tax=Cladophialophora yegresii CBS 114405 TaxID=1182544 RepID=W9W8Q9_9EURO|nr:uncharacterized protein A1O7_00843 [Cladophialophora yegresii CBS 114405]EXJ64507.1 hypothetical protein A1O7_00843 [Cladophialophora yegresii CBS 114405]